MIDKNLLQKYAEDMGSSLTFRQLELFDIYAKMLVDWNGCMNLTAITEPREIVIKHFIDSISLLAKARIGEGASLIDVGSGAGFPGLPLAILRGDLRITLMDSLNKRINFLNAVVAELSISNVTTVHMRAEQAGRDVRFREQFDFAAARAVTSLPALLEYCLPLVRVNGVFLPQKGGEKYKDEMAASGPALSLLGGRVRSVEEFSLPEDGGQRCVIFIDKISACPAKYPRTAVKISGNPL